MEPKYKNARPVRLNGAGIAFLCGSELSRNVQSENAPNLLKTGIRRRDERSVLKFLVPQVGDHLH